MLNVTSKTEHRGEELKRRALERNQSYIVTNLKWTITSSNM